MAIITVSTPFNIDLEFQVAAFGKRLFAWFIDIVIISLYFVLVLLFVAPLLGYSEAISTATMLLVVVLPVLLYQLLCELMMNGQTLGKKVAGIKVIDIEGREPTWGQYISRWMLCIGNLFIFIIPYYILTNFYLLFVCLIIYLPDFLSVMISAKNQRLGDLAAGTIVIDKKYRPSIRETIYLEIDDTDYQPLFPQVMRLSDRDINGIRDLLNIKNKESATDNYIINVAQKIKTVLAIESDLYPTDFLEQLLKDYNYYSNPRSPQTPKGASQENMPSA